MTLEYREFLISEIDNCQDELSQEEARVRENIKSHVKEYGDLHPQWITKSRIEFLKGKLWYADLAVLWYQHRHRVAMAKDDMTSAGVTLLMAKEAKGERDRLVREMNREANRNVVHQTTDQITESMIQRAKEFPFVDLLAQYGWQGKRGLYVCQFHGDKDASFHVRRRDNRGRCFGCNWKDGKYADTIDFTMEVEGITWAEAVRRLQ